MKKLSISAQSSTLKQAKGPNFTQQMHCSWYFSASAK